jgi:hypothetical protein
MHPINFRLHKRQQRTLRLSTIMTEGNEAVACECRRLVQIATTIPVQSRLSAAAIVTLKVNKTKNCILKNFLQNDRNGSTNAKCATFAHWRIFFMDTSAPSQDNKVGLATQHCLTLAIPVDVAKLLELLELFGGGGPKRVAELFAGANPHSAVGGAKLNNRAAGWFISQTRSSLQTTCFW